MGGDRTIAEAEGKTTSIHITADAARLAEKLGIENAGPATTYNQNAIPMAAAFADLRRDKKQEIEKEIAQLKEEAEKFGLELVAHIEIADLDS